MFYKKKVKTTVKKQINIDILDFSGGINANKDSNVLDMDRAVSSYNFCFKNGVLTEGLGFTNLSLPVCVDDPSTQSELTLYENQEAVKIWHFKHYYEAYGGVVDKLMMYSKTGEIFYARVFDYVPEFLKLSTVTFTDVPTALNIKKSGENYIVLTSESDNMLYWDEIITPTVVTSAPHLTSICENDNKLFATTGGKKNIIRYSTNFDITTWTDTLEDANSGYLELDDSLGCINKVISFDGYVYAIRDFGITRITTYTSLDDMEVANMFASGSRIYAETVAVCNDKIMMLTKSGIYEFDGDTAQKVDLDIDSMFEDIHNESAVADFHEGKYYVACKVNFNDDNSIGCELETNYNNNCLIEYDIEDESYNIVRGVDIISMKSIQVLSLSKLIVCFNTGYSELIGEICYNGKFFTDSTSKYWESALSDLKYPENKKYVRELNILVKQDCTIKVFTETQEKIFNVTASNSPTKLRVGITGYLVGVSFETTNDTAYISNAKIKVDLL